METHEGRSFFRGTPEQFREGVESSFYGRGEDWVGWGAFKIPSYVGDLGLAKARDYSTAHGNQRKFSKCERAKSPTIFTSFSKLKINLKNIDKPNK